LLKEEKMRLVVDANVIFSVLIKEGKTDDLFFNFSLDLYAPEYIFLELEKHKEEILRKTKRTELEFYRLLEIFKSVIKIIPNSETDDYTAEAESISPDPNDSLYLALALKMNIPIWTNDKKLKEQKRVKIYSTEELVKEIEG
jgi:predicted nucleic acid-binding protein